MQVLATSVLLPETEGMGSLVMVDWLLLLKYPPETWPLPMGNCTLVIQTTPVFVKLT